MHERLRHVEEHEEALVGEERVRRTNRRIRLQDTSLPAGSSIGARGVTVATSCGHRLEVGV
eukprot:COSAG01_NODE_368_length_18064_cov_5.721959_5_plen_61_part_00